MEKKHKQHVNAGAYSVIIEQWKHQRIIEITGTCKHEPFGLLPKPLRNFGLLHNYGVLSRIAQHFLPLTFSI